MICWLKGTDKPAGNGTDKFLFFRILFMNGKIQLFVADVVSLYREYEYKGNLKI